MHIAHCTLTYAHSHSNFDTDNTPYGKIIVFQDAIDILVDFVVGIESELINSFASYEDFATTIPLHRFCSAFPSFRMFVAEGLSIVFIIVRQCLGGVYGI